MTFLSYLLIGFATSLISGVFGLLGGMILMVILLSLLSVPSAMLLSALSQLVSNSWRCWLWRKHIVWRVLPPYFAGMVLAACVIGAVGFIPGKALAFFLMGILPLAGLALKSRFHLSILSPVQSFVGATFLAFVQLTAGVIGPLLDLLYVNTPLTRQQIISTKSFTQTGMHLLRLFYYGTLTALITGDFDWPKDLPVLNVVSCVIGIVTGTAASTLVVNRMSDKLFKRLLNILIFIVSLYCIWQSYRIWRGG